MLKNNMVCESIHKQYLFKYMHTQHPESEISFVTDF